MNPPFDAIRFGGGTSRLQELLPAMHEAGYLTGIFASEHRHAWRLDLSEIHTLCDVPYSGTGEGIKLRCRCPHCGIGHRGLAINLHRSVFFCHACGWSGGFTKLVTAFDTWYFERLEAKHKS